MNGRTAQALVFCGLMVAALFARAQDDVAAIPDIIVTSGVEGGGYWSAGERFSTVASELGLIVDNQPSAGSMDNLGRLFDPNSPFNMAFAQADALEEYLMEHDEDRTRVEVVENIGQECVFIVGAEGSDIESGADLQNNSEARVGISSPEGGASITWSHMVTRVPELAGVEVVYGDTLGMLDSLESYTAEVDAVMVVHRPREHSAEVKKVLAAPDSYEFVRLEDERLTLASPEGDAVYRGMRLAMPKPVEPVQTICVRGLLLANKAKFDSATRNRLTDLINYHWIRVFATP
ncbi:MAG: hypothetical protein MK097_18450 [Dechloromonas sp.]|nr:hypothetical protein [Dechloromonas sp.]